MNDEKTFESREFIEQQLFETQQMLFSARSIREVQFLQSKLDYLKQRMKSIRHLTAKPKAKARVAKKKK
jgi:hypothetical protein